MLQGPDVQRLGRTGFSQSDLQDDGGIGICSGGDEHGRGISN